VQRGGVAVVVPDHFAGRRRPVSPVQAGFS
jgi:hypothetical protein